MLDALPRSPCLSLVRAAGSQGVRNGPPGETVYALPTGRRLAPLRGLLVISRGVIYSVVTTPTV